MTAGRYTISISSRVADEIRAAFAEAKRLGVAAATLTSYEAAVERLARDPMDYGEARDNLPAMGVRVRIAMEPPLVFQFGVHEEARIVWVKSVALRVPGRR